MSKIKDAMMNDNLAVTAGGGWDAVPDRDSGMIHGRIIKFADGYYTISESTEPANGRVLVVAGVVPAWVKWRDGKPVEHRITQSRMPHPEREDLPDLDQNDWPAGLDGQPADPWQDTRYLYLADPQTGEEFTFTTSSWGGRRAIADLRNQIANIRYANQGAIPVIRLDTDKMKTRFGLKPKPLFTVVAWRGGAGEVKQVNNNKQIEAPKTESAIEHSRRKMDDEIPF
jgi:hypothetical protein